MSGVPTGLHFVLSIVLVLIRWTAAKLPRPRNPVFRLALANLHRPAAQTGKLVVALGLGLALPFLLLAFVPALRRRLPRPGAWMLRLQRFLAPPMAIAAAEWP